MLIPLVLIAGILAQAPTPGSLRGEADLVAAARLADLARARELVAAGVAVDVTDRRGYTPLMWASAAGSAELTRFLLDSGAQVDSRGADGATALFLASANGAIEVVRLLVARGANPTITRGGQTARQVAAARGHAEVAAVLDTAGSQPPARPAAEPGVSGPRPAVPAPSVAESLRAIDGLLARSAPAAEAAGAHRRAAAALAELQSLSARWPADSPDDYRANLAVDATALAEALAQQDPAVLGKALDGVADDLEAKLEHCRRSGGRLGGSVLVRVRTVQAGAEAARWQVFYMPKILEVSPTASPDLFPQLSSPTEDLLVPGRYLMWVRNPATTAVGERTVVKVGEGRKELVVDLPVPAGSR